MIATLALGDAVPLPLLVAVVVARSPFRERREEVRIQPTLPVRPAGRSGLDSSRRRRIPPAVFNDLLHLPVAAIDSVQLDRRSGRSKSGLAGRRYGRLFGDKQLRAWLRLQLPGCEMFAIDRTTIGRRG